MRNIYRGSISVNVAVIFFTTSLSRTGSRPVYVGRACFMAAIYSDISQPLTEALGYWDIDCLGEGGGFPPRGIFLPVFQFNALSDPTPPTPHAQLREGAL